MKTAPQTYSLQIRSIKTGEDDAPEIIRLRNLLKIMFRGYAFRCLTITPQIDFCGADGDGI